jgi:protein-S-isoprenylcysteine O-methyltransferase Ste14
MQRWRIRLSQLCGLLFLLAFAFSDIKLDVRHPYLAEGMFFAGCLMVGVATVGRIWCALYIAGYKTNTLITVGPYSLCRNPLYFFSMVGATGVALCTQSLTLVGVVLLGFAVFYSLTIKAEENDMRKTFGETYEQYVATVPRFFPSFSHFQEPESYTVRAKYFKREAFDAFWFVVAIGLLEFIEVLVDRGIIPHLFHLY